MPKKTTFRATAILGTAAALALSLALVPLAAAQINSLTKSGLELTSEDWELLESAAAKLYAATEARVGSVESWSNAQSGNGGSIELIQTGEYQGMPCRRLRHEIKVKDIADIFRLTVDRCRTAEGDWKTL